MEPAPLPPHALACVLLTRSIHAKTFEKRSSWSETEANGRSGAKSIMGHGWRSQCSLCCDGSAGTFEADRNVHPPWGCRAFVSFFVAEHANVPFDRHAAGEDWHLPLRPHPESVAEHANVPIDQRPVGEDWHLPLRTHPESVAEHANVPIVRPPAGEDWHLPLRDPSGKCSGTCQCSLCFGGSAGTPRWTGMSTLLGAAERS